jgi:hypothetical protein
MNNKKKDHTDVQNVQWIQLIDFYLLNLMSQLILRVMVEKPTKKKSSFSDIEYQENFYYIFNISICCFNCI